ncbi:Adaptin ear-binding coat-associated protein 2 [Nymphaea thermarum]|nr:Adaptin ear-binding coat-associated protein 2 [Nymphaea thermarum]
MEEEFDPRSHKDDEAAESLELVLFHVNECYVYLIPPRKSAASYRADEWNVNKWAWEGILKVVSKGEECMIRLEDKSTGELYAQAFLRNGEPHPVEPVIDSSRYFVLRVEEDFDGRIRHAFIGIGFRERPQAYDFQAALHDHMKYLNKKQAAEEMEQNYSSKPSTDYSLKEGEKIVLHIKNQTGSSSVKPTDQNHNRPSLDDKPTVSLKPPPPPPPAVKSLPSSPFQKSPPYRCGLRTQGSLDDSFPHFTEELEVKEASSSAKESATQNVEDDFGDFQVAQ